jgi:hypothetical protein
MVLNRVEIAFKWRRNLRFKGVGNVTELLHCGRLIACRNKCFTLGVPHGSFNLLASRLPALLKSEPETHGAFRDDSRFEVRGWQVIINSVGDGAVDRFDTFREG